MNKNEEKILIKKLKLAMLESGLNQTQLAKKLGISSTSISQWLLGKTKPKYSTLEAVGKITGKPINYFFDNSTAVNGNNNVVGEQNTINPNLKEEIALIKKELEVHRYQIENIVLKLEKIQKQK